MLSLIGNRGKSRLYSRPTYYLLLIIIVVGEKQGYKASVQKWCVCVCVCVCVCGVINHSRNPNIVYIVDSSLWMPAYAYTCIHIHKVCVYSIYSTYAYIRVRMYMYVNTG